MKRNSATASIEFWLPQGFERFPDDDFVETVDVFFLLYAVIRRFARERGLWPDERQPRRDGFFQRASDVSLVFAANETALTFSKVAAFEAVMDVFDEMTLAAIISKTRPALPIDLRQFKISMDRAVFNEDDTFFPESAPAKRMEIEDGGSTLASLFSFVYSELAARIDPALPPHPEIASRAARFREEHLTESSGLFDPQSARSVIPVLKDILEQVHRHTAYKDDDYWLLYDALEFFFYRDELVSDSSGTPVWGVSDFHPIWEEMGHAVVGRLYADSEEGSVKYSDRQRPSRYPNSPNGFGDDYPFFIRYDDEARFLFPDVVTLRTTANQGSRSKFDEVIRLNVTSASRGILLRAVVRPNPDRPQAPRWIDSLKHELRKTGFTPHLVDGGGVEWRNIPRSIFERAFDRLYQKFRSIPREDTWYIIDFKYVSPLDLLASPPTDKTHSDIQKQLVYEAALADYISGLSSASWTIRNELLFPHYVRALEPLTVDFVEFPLESFGEGRIPTSFADQVTFLGLNFKSAAYDYLGAGK